MEDCFPGCGCELLSLLGKRWSIFLIMHLMKSKIMRFNEFLDVLNSLSPKTLSKRLKQFEEMELIVRDVIPTSPVRVEYSLTQKGRDLGNVLQQLKSLVHSWRAK
jgi:DNA-binding HxlR family transcriptional regulator